MSRLLSVAVATVLVLCGCGGSTKAVTVTSAGGGAASSSTETASATSTPTGSTAGLSASTTQATATTLTRSSPQPRIVHVSNFTSPSGNIGCSLLGASARCDTDHRIWSPPPRPSTCQLDYGQGLVVTTSGPGRLVCAGDTALNPSAPVLSYDTASAVGPYQCASLPSGMTCTNERTRHGFFLSRQAYRTF